MTNHDMGNYPINNKWIQKSDMRCNRSCIFLVVIPNYRVRCSSQYLELFMATCMNNESDFLNQFNEMKIKELNK